MNKHKKTTLLQIDGGKGRQESHLRSFISALFLYLFHSHLLEMKFCRHFLLFVVVQMCVYVSVCGSIVTEQTRFDVNVMCDLVIGGAIILKATSSLLDLQVQSWLPQSLVNTAFRSTLITANKKLRSLLKKNIH